MSVTFQALAFGALRKNPANNQYIASMIGVADTSAMPEPVRAYLARHLDSLIQRSEAYGHAQPGWWTDGGPPAQIANLMPASRLGLQRVLPAALDRLTTATPATASAGLLAFVRFSDQVPFLAIVKLDMDERELYRFRSGARAEGVIEYQKFQDVLPSVGDIKKAALIPNPSTPNVDLRVVDDEAVEGAASYWLNFLGVRVTPPALKLLRTAIETTRGVLSEQFDAQTVHQAVGRALTGVVRAERPVTARQFVTRARSSRGSRAKRKRMPYGIRSLCHRNSLFSVANR